MCIIIDNCVVVNVLLERNTKYCHILKALFDRKNKLIIGGLLKDEYLRNNNIRQIIKQLDQSGISKIIPKSEIEHEKQLVEDSGHCISNDTHIIALARVGGARVLCSDDAKLQADFKNPSLISAPRGKIYKNARHKKIVEENNVYCSHHTNL